MKNSIEETAPAREKLTAPAKEKLTAPAREKLTAPARAAPVTEPLLLPTPVMKHVLSIYLYINVLFFPLALWIEIEQIFCKDEKRPS